MTQPATLALEDGSLFTGISVGIPGQAVGEVVFNTAMTGYQEILTDPSYAKQIVTLTYPHIGNTGTNAEDMESAAVFAACSSFGLMPSLSSCASTKLSMGFRGHSSSCTSGKGSCRRGW